MPDKESNKIKMSQSKVSQSSLKNEGKSNNRIFLGVLIAALVALGIFTFLNNQRHVNTESTLLEEKESILKDLTIMENQYNEAISKNTEYSNELEIQRNSIVKFRDSLKRVKTTNWKAIKFYKNKIASLNATNSRLFRINDSIVKRNKLLNYENQDLTQQKDSLSSNLNEQMTFNDTLVKQNLTLAKKVSIAEIVKASGLRMTSYKERNNGEFTVTDKARRVDAFKIGFTLVENLIAKDQDITAYVILKDPNGKLVADNGIFTKSDGSEIHFSDKTVIPYKRAAIITDVILNTNGQKLEKGVYTASVYLEEKLVGSIKKFLK